MKIKFFLDGADIQQMLQVYRERALVCGYTTNPTLMRKAGVKDYEGFARELLSLIKDFPISFEVFSDDLPEMERQARKIASWGNNVYVKIPVTNTKGKFTGPIIKNLATSGIKLNITAVFTTEQVQSIIENLSEEIPSIISIFAGRIANAGVDPMPIIKESVDLTKKLSRCEILWASPREAFNCVQAEACGCHIITVTSDILKTVGEFGKSLEQFSLETVQMFYNDARASAFSL